MKKTFLALFTAALLAVSASAKDAPGDKPSTATLQPAGLELKITAASTTIKTGEYPKIAAVITNKGDKAVTLVMPGDGSESGWRTPLVGWSVIQHDARLSHPAAVPLYKGGRCGNMNPLTKEEVFTLQPGASKQLTWIGGPECAAGQKYRVVFYYSNVPETTWRRGAGDAEAMKQVKQSFKCLLRSNEIEIEVKGK